MKILDSVNKMRKKKIKILCKLTYNNASQWVVLRFPRWCNDADGPILRFPFPSNTQYGELCHTRRISTGTSLMVQWLRLHCPMQEVWVWSHVWELRCHMPCGQKNQNMKQEQCCNKFNKDFKNGPHQKKEKCFKKEWWDLMVKQKSRNKKFRLLNLPTCIYHALDYW